ncbi:hypothetical protein BJ165DRAFT_1532016 [Panaeolus papilionaceus]|nr:hypothetical protein BJ165DRAFT_1532016 [Panaeolus papilionaceus]
MASPSEENLYHIVNIPDRTVQADDKVIVLLGPTGAGKSNFIERLADNDLRISSSGTHRGTNDLQVYRLMHHPIWNSRIVLVDTPGFKDRELSEYGTLKIVKEWLVTCNASRLHGLFYFDRIKYNLRGGDKEYYDLFMRLCGKDGAARACLVTTTWDDVRMSDRLLAAAEEKRHRLKALWKSHLGKGLQFCEFQNTSTSAMEILVGSLKCDDYSHRFVLENPKINLIKPPLEDLVFKLLAEKYDATVGTQEGLEEHINVLREQGQETEQFIKKLDALRAVVERLEDELLEFKRGRKILEERRKEQHAYIAPPRNSPERATTSPRVDHQMPGSQAQAMPNPPLAGPSDPTGRPEPVRLDSLHNKVNAAVQVNPEDIQLDDIVIAVIGSAGTGKTTFIQSVVGTLDIGLKINHTMAAITLGVTCVKIAILETHSSLVLVDTPGFDDADMTNAQILDIIEIFFKLIYRRRILLNGLVYLHRITDIRHDSSVEYIMKNFQRLYGPNVFERVSLVTTMWNDLRDKQIGVEREEQLMNNHWRPMIIRKAMTGRFDSNNRETAVKVIRDIVERNTKPVLLQLQEELVDKKKSLPSTSAGKVAFTLEEAMKWHLHQLRGTLRLSGRP